MHPHLHTKDNTGCEEIMDMLEACHAQSFWHRATGGCNAIKTKVNQCMRAERLERTRRNAEAAKLRRQKTEQVWHEIDAES